MATAIRITYYGMDGEGATLKEAKADAARKVERALEGSYTPEMIRFDDWAVLLWREPFGWHYKLIGGVCAGNLYGCTRGDHDEVREYAIYHLVSATYNPHDDASVERALAYLGTHGTLAHIANLKTDVRFQRAYRQLRDAGVPESDCHRQVCEAMRS